MFCTFNSNKHLIARTKICLFLVQINNVLLVMPRLYINISDFNSIKTNLKLKLGLFKSFIEIKLFRLLLYSAIIS